MDEAPAGRRGLRDPRPATAAPSAAAPSGLSALPHPVPRPPFPSAAATATTRKGD